MVPVRRSEKHKERSSLNQSNNSSKQKRSLTNRRSTTKADLFKLFDTENNGFITGVNFIQ